MKAYLVGFTEIRNGKVTRYDLGPDCRVEGHRLERWINDILQAPDVIGCHYREIV